MMNVLAHVSLGFCWVDPIALLILLMVVVFYVARIKKLSNTEKSLMERAAQPDIAELEIPSV